MAASSPVARSATTRQPVRVDRAAFTDVTAHMLQDLGLAQHDAADVADILVWTDARGIGTHGTFCVPIHYAKPLRLGGIKPDAKPLLVKETGSTAIVDGDAGLGTSRPCLPPA